MLLDTCETEFETSPPVVVATALRDDSQSAQRVLDVTVALAAILFCLPLLVVLSVLIMLQDGGPPIYSQVRIGQNGRPFKCYKFRSMVVDAPLLLERLLQSSEDAREEWERDHKLKNDPRITALGRFLRRSSLDELPQFFNVLEGSMSVVGPRPIVQSEMSRYGRRIRHYLAVRPGITGLWQISGRNDIDYRRRVALDCLYVSRRSTVFDLRILLATVPSVLLHRGAY